MSSPVKHYGSEIEQILAAIRQQARGHDPAVASPSVTSAAEPVPANDEFDLPQFVTRRDDGPGVPQATVHPFRRPGTGRLADALRKVGVAPVEPVAPVAPVARDEPVAVPAPVAARAEPRREMVSFLDTRMQKMCGPGDSVAPDAEGRAPQDEGATPMGLLVPVHQTVHELDNAGYGQGLGLSDDAVALLRPLLKQWLAENMPRMVEKALTMELHAALEKRHGAAP